MAKKVRDAEATRRKLIIVGEALFAQKGYKATTLSDIAAAAGVNKAMTAYHFGGKEQLYEAVIKDVVQSVLADVKSALQEGEAPDIQMRNYIRVIGEAFFNRQTFSSILVREYLDSKMQERENPASDISQFFKTTRRIYQSGRRAKLFAKTDPHMLHLTIVGSLIYFTITIPYREAMRDKAYWPLNVPEPEAFIRHTQRTVLAMLTGGQR